MTWLFLLFVTLSTCSCSTAFVNLTSPSYIVVPAALSPSSFVGDAIASQETKRDDEGGAYTISNQPETAQGGEVSTDRQSGGDDESGDSEVEVVPPRWSAQLGAYNFLFLLEHGARERESIYSKARFLGWCQNKKEAEDRWKAQFRKNPQVEGQPERGGSSGRELHKVVAWRQLSQETEAEEAVRGGSEAGQLSDGTVA